MLLKITIVQWLAVGMANEGTALLGHALSMQVDMPVMGAWAPARIGEFDSAARAETCRGNAHLPLLLLARYEGFG
jgi:hypothetical protein